jgi:hypothetical protein
MSSFITFQEDMSARVWNSTFKTILRRLEACSAKNKIAARILKENPIAAQIAGLNLKSLTNEEILGFIQFLSGLRSEAAVITEAWSFPKQIAQFPIDLESTIEKANKAVVATGYRSESK